LSDGIANASQTKRKIRGSRSGFRRVKEEEKLEIGQGSRETMVPSDQQMEKKKIEEHGKQGKKRNDPAFPRQWVKKVSKGGRFPVTGLTPSQRKGLKTGTPRRAQKNKDDASVLSP